MSEKNVDSPGKPKDVRVRRTRAWLYEALLILSREMEYKKITVSALTKKAGVARQTFYRNYDSIDDILIEKDMELFENLMFEMEEPETLEEVVRTALKVILEQKEFVILIQRAGLEEAVFRTSVGNAGSVIKKLYPDMPETDLTQVAEFMLMGLKTLIRSWIKEGCTMSEEELTRRVLILSKSCFEVCEQGGFS